MIDFRQEGMDILADYLERFYVKIREAVRAYVDKTPERPARFVSHQFFQGKVNNRGQPKEEELVELVDRISLGLLD